MPSASSHARRVLVDVVAASPLISERPRRHLLRLAGASIGDAVTILPGLSVEDVAGLSISAGIVVGDGALVGARATVLPGVTIGRGCVIGAGAVVTRDCVDHGVYVGIPARLTRVLSPATGAGPLLAG